jgi:transcriptional regulator
MYRPAHFALPHDELTAFVGAAGPAHLVTRGPEGLDASVVPMLLDPGVGPNGALLGHLARANPQWRDASGRAALAIFTGPDAYVSPSMYPTKPDDPRVVPTWNYEVAHVHGRLVVHDDPMWVEQLVRRLTDRHELGRDEPWSVDDAPAEYIERMVRAIVGIEVVIDRIEGKRKLSQNRPEVDRVGVESALAAGPPADQAVAAAMRRLTG